MADEPKRADMVKDFLEWSGGFPPESSSQITIYLDYAISVDMTRESASNMLHEWLKNESEGEYHDYSNLEKLK